MFIHLNCTKSHHSFTGEYMNRLLIVCDRVERRRMPERPRRHREDDGAQFSDCHKKLRKCDRSIFHSQQLIYPTVLRKEGLLGMDDATLWTFCCCGETSLWILSEIKRPKPKRTSSNEVPHSCRIGKRKYQQIRVRRENCPHVGLFWQAERQRFSFSWSKRSSVK